MSVMLELKGKHLGVQSAIWQDEIFDDFYRSHFDKISSKKFDLEFYNGLRSLSSSLSKLSASDRKIVINILTSLIEHYVTNKLDKEMDMTFQRVFKF